MSASRVFAAALAVLTWFALALQLWVSIRLVLANGGTVGTGIGVYLYYFTVLTNILVAVVLTAAAMGRISGALGDLELQSAALLYILVVGLVYLILLSPLLDPKGWGWLADALLHYAVPVLYLVYWLVCVPKGSLRWSQPTMWLAFPLAYFAYALIRGGLTGRYPYPFIDVAALGYGRVFVNAAMLTVACWVGGLVIVAVDRALGRGAPLKSFAG